MKLIDGLTDEAKKKIALAYLQENGIELFDQSEHFKALHATEKALGVNNVWTIGSVSKDALTRFAHFLAGAPYNGLNYSDEKLEKMLHYYRVLVRAFQADARDAEADAS